VLFTLGSAASAGAQEDNRVAIGIGYTHRLASAQDAHGNGGVGIKWRLGHTESGWNRQFGLGWFATDLDRTVGGRRVSFGELKVRPIVAGYGYTHSFSRAFHITGDVVGGLAFTSFRLSDEAKGTLRSVRGESVDAEISSVIPVLRPEVSLWYDIHPKFGLSIGAGYTIARPRLALVSAGARAFERVNADSFSLSGGLVYRVF
jgi:hypothetical protein